MQCESQDDSIPVLLTWSRATLYLMSLTRVAEGQGNEFYSLKSSVSSSPIKQSSQSQSKYMPSRQPQALSMMRTPWSKEKTTMIWNLNSVGML